jgi:hypothetical protein
MPPAVVSLISSSNHVLEACVFGKPSSQRSWQLNFNHLAHFLRAAFRHMLNVIEKTAH